MLAILSCHNRLGKRRVKKPALLNPGRLKRGHDALNVRHELRDDLFLTHSKERIVHCAIVAEVHQVPPTIFGGRAKVCMLDHSHKGVATIANVDPVAALGQLAVQREDQAVRAIRLTPVIFCAVVVRERGNESAGEARRQRREHAVKLPRSLAGPDVPASIDLFHLLYTGAKQNLASLLADALYQSFVDELKAAAQISELRGTIIEAIPEPGQGNLIIERAKLSDEQGLKEHLVGTFAHPAAQPGIGGLPLHRAGSTEFEKSCHRRHAQTLVDPPGLEAQEGKRRVQLVNLASDQAHRAGSQPFQPLAQPQLFYDADRRLIRAEEVMIEFFQPDSVDLKACRQPARHLLLLK